jgi:hypothetical protein
LFISKGGLYLNYLLKFILLIKSFFLKFLSIFSSLEGLTSKIVGDHKGFKSNELLPNAFLSNTFFYKTRISSSYLSYISNIVSYISILSLFSDIDYKNFYKNKNLFYFYFLEISLAKISFSPSRSVINNLDLNTLENLYLYNSLPNLNNLNSHFFSFFASFLKNKFSSNSSLRLNENKLSAISTFNPRSLYAFINAQTYTVHNTKLEII